MAKQPTEIELSITSLSEAGLGGGEHNDRPVWVRNALPGEVAKAKILKRKGSQRFADGQPVDQLSADRVPSPCPYFPRCGGCATHHMSADAQLKHKQRQLAEQLKLQQIEPLSWRAPVSLLRLGYRRKARLGVRVVIAVLLAYVICNHSLSRISRSCDDSRQGGQLRCSLKSKAMTLCRGLTTTT